MEKLRDKKKHDHLLTKLLKASIFSIVMLAPFFAILSKIMYVSFNKNAYESYYAETINQETKIYNKNGIYESNEEYYYHFVDYNYTNTINFYTNNFKLVNNGNLTSQVITLLNDNETIRVYCDSNNHRYSFYGNNGYIVATPLGADFIAKFDLLSVDNGGNDLINDFYTLEYNNLSFLDNAFYYAVNQLDEMSLFNWTKNTGLYTTLNAMCSGLDVGTNILAILLTYWALMTAIYIVFDIIIELFTKITHILA